MDDLKIRESWLLGSVFIVATSGLVYELIAGSISSYLLGDAVTQFSLVIGVFLSAMGLGSYVVQFIQKNLLLWFVRLELWIALIGGTSSLLIYGTSAFLSSIFEVVFYCLCASIGALVGAEIPLLIRILKEDQEVEQALSNVLALDYFGALIASLLFPFIVVPYIGTARASIIFGLLNVGVAWIGIRLLEKGNRQSLQWQSIGLGVFLICLLGLSGKMISFLESTLYQDNIIYAQSTPYQRIILTKWRDDIRLHLNGHIQFSSVDEARYHEVLVHPILSTLSQPPKDVLILGGGDGLAVREILKYESVDHIDLVDIDPAVTELASTLPLLRQLNQDALLTPKVHIHHEDAMQFVQETEHFYDAIIVDLPDPNSEPLCKLYSTAFYTLLHRRLREQGGIITQATSPYYSKLAFWSIVTTVEEVAQQQELFGSSISVLPLHVQVPSFGEWGFVLYLKNTKVELGPLSSELETSFLSNEILQTLSVFGKDMQREKVESNHLTDPVLFQYYRKGWQHFND